MQQPFVLDDEGGRLERSPDHLVRVPRDAVNLLAALHQMPQFLGEDNGTSPTGVNVQPDVVSLTNISESVKVIIGSKNCGSRGGVDKIGNPVFRFD